MEKELLEEIKRILLELQRLNGVRKSQSAVDAESAAYAAELFGVQPGAVDADVVFDTADILQLINEVARDIQALLAETGVESIPNFGQLQLPVAQALLASIEPGEDYGMGPGGRAIARIVSRRNREIRAFPAYPTRTSQLRTVLQYFIDQGYLTEDDVYTLDGERDRNTAGVIERIRVDLPTIMTAAVVESGVAAVPDSPKNLTAQFDSESLEETFQNVIVPLHERQWTELREQAASLALNEKGELLTASEIVDRVLRSRGIPIAEALYTDAVERKAFNTFRLGLIEAVKDMGLRLLESGNTDADVAGAILGRVRAAVDTNLGPTIERAKSNAQALEDADTRATEQAAVDAARELEQTPGGSKTIANQLLFDMRRRTDIEPIGELSDDDLQLLQDIIAEGGTQAGQEFLEEFSKELGLREEAARYRTIPKAEAGLKQFLAEQGLQEEQLTPERRANLQQFIFDNGLGALTRFVKENPRQLFDWIQESLDVALAETQATRAASIGENELRGILIDLGFDAEVGGFSQTEKILGQHGREILQRIVDNPSMDPRDVVAQSIGVQAAEVEPRTDRFTAERDPMAPPIDPFTTPPTALAPTVPPLANLQFADTRAFTERFDPGRPPSIPGFGFMPTQTTNDWSIGQFAQPSRVEFPEPKELTEFINREAGADPQYQEFLVQQAQAYLPEFRASAAEAQREQERLAHERARGFELQGDFTAEQRLALFRQESSGALPLPGGTQGQLSFLPKFESKIPEFRKSFEGTPSFLAREESRRKSEQRELESQRITEESQRIREESRRQKRLRGRGRTVFV